MKLGSLLIKRLKKVAVMKEGLSKWLRKPGEMKFDVIKVGAIASIPLLAVISSGVYFLNGNVEARGYREPPEVTEVGLPSNDIEKSYENPVVFQEACFDEIEEDWKSPDEKKGNASDRSQGEKDRLRREKALKNEKKKEAISKKSTEQPFYLEEGVLIPAILVSSVVMKDTKVPARFEVTEDIFGDSGEIIITEGSLVFGDFSAFNEQGRVFGKIKRLKIPGERIRKIEADILSSDETFGLTGIYRDEKGRYLAGSIALNFLGAFAQGFKSRMVAELGDKLTEYSTGNLKNAILNALEKTAFDEAQREAGRLKAVKPFVVIPKGTPAVLMVSETVEMKEGEER